MSADVFVDRTGRRRRILTWLAVAAAAALLGALGLLGAGVFAGAPLPLRGWTEHGGSAPGPDTAVIGPAPASTPAAVPATPTRAVAPSVPPRATRSAVAPTGPSSGASDQPGRRVGADNRPTAKPSHPNPKAG
ncbi:hypothetical protein [Asanoa sp. NPDC050611]|uniref:hypothetical protein n=1 Tax=Asanoa sp. NPDC050611 TaxID=3157098 RepID=UPI0033F0AABD